MADDQNQIKEPPSLTMHAQFIKDLSFVIESIKSSIYRDLDIQHEMQPLVDKFMVQEKDKKGNTNTIFKMELIPKFLKALDKKKNK